MVKIENLSFAYGPSKQVFDQFNLSLAAGNIYGLLGKNGAGKSSLLKLISGLLFPTSGKLEVMGFMPKDRKPGFLREIYMLTEEFYVPSMKIEAYVRLYSPFYPRFNQDLFETYLEEFNLSKKENLEALSYGQKKQALLSFGLATDCKLLILDEPTNGLDIPSKSQFRKVVANAIHEERNFIISTHQVRDMENLIDPIIILDEGKVVFFQEWEQVSRKLAFSRQAKLQENHGVVYAESTLGGYMVVKENQGMEESNLNLETLFKAVINNGGKINEIFKR